MFFAIPVFFCLLFVACMVFIFGYVFGSFSKKKSLVTLTKVATILIVVLFIGSRIFFVTNLHRSHGWCPWNENHPAYDQRDSTWHR